jgi:hypothetical protein
MTAAWGNAAHKLPRAHTEVASRKIENRCSDMACMLKLKSASSSASRVPYCWQVLSAMRFELRQALKRSCRRGRGVPTAQKKSKVRSHFPESRFTSSSPPRLDRNHRAPFPSQQRCAALLCPSLGMPLLLQTFAWSQFFFLTASSFSRAQHPLNMSAEDELEEYTESAVQHDDAEAEQKKYAPYQIQPPLCFEHGGSRMRRSQCRVMPPHRSRIQSQSRSAAPTSLPPSEAPNVLVSPPI